MIREIHSTDRAPGAIGPYSQAVRASGNFLFLSGSIPLTPGGDLVMDSIQAQTEQVMKNMQGLLESAGLGFENLVKTTIFLSSMDHFVAVNEIYARYLGEAPCARSTIAVAGLPKGVDIEIEGIAVY